MKYDVDSLIYLNDINLCRNTILPLLREKLGFFTNYSMSDDMLRGILSSFPLLIKNKGSIEAIQQAVNIFLKVLNLKTEVIIKAVGDSTETVHGGITVDPHTILIAISAALQNFYVLEELFRYIMPAGYSYTFYFYRDLNVDSWLYDNSRGRFLIASNLTANSIRSESMYNQDFGNMYVDPQVNKLLNQINTINLFTEDYNSLSTSNFTMKQLNFEPSCFADCYYFFYKIVDDKYVQLTEPETYQSETYYIPQFIFINEIEEYELLLEDPIIEYGSDTIRLLEVEYYNYYTIVSGMPGSKDCKYKNLQGPVEFEENKYYKISESTKVKAIANDVISYTDVPITSEYIETLAVLNS